MCRRIRIGWEYSELKSYQSINVTMNKSEYLLQEYFSALGFHDIEVFWLQVYPVCVFFTVSPFPPSLHVRITHSLPAVLCPPPPSPRLSSLLSLFLSYLYFPSHSLQLTFLPSPYLLVTPSFSLPPSSARSPLLSQ